MTTYNKLKIAIFTIMSSPSLYAITLDPIQIQSAPGELLYAEMKFHQADLNSDLQVGLATADDLSHLGVMHQPPGNLNFYTRRNAQGEGVIVITSSRPVIDPELNIVIKVQEGNATRLQHIKTAIKPTTAPATNDKPLTPQFISSEKDIALNLPESKQYTQPVTEATATRSPTEQSLKINTTAAPSLSTAKISAPVHTPVVQAVAPTTASDTPNQTVAKQPPQQPQPTKLERPKAAAEPKKQEQAKTTTKPKTATEPKIPEKKVEPHKKPNKPIAHAVKKQTSTLKAPAASSKYVVQHNESLWSIANRIAVQTHRPVAVVMQEIQKQNQHAFIQGDVNRLRQGSALNLVTMPTPQKVSSTPVKTAQNPAAKTRYRLEQAEMSLVAESEQNSVKGTAKKSTEQAQNPTELAVKVMTARKKNVTLQRNVTALDQALRLKDQRIQILNARLAELQQQLKTQQQAQKPKH